MKKINVALILVILSILLCIPASAKEYFIIKDYEINIVVNEDYTYDITEKIYTEFSQQRRGIYRDIPTSNSDIRAMISDISVRGYKYTVMPKSNMVRIRIGDPDVYVDGKQLYEIKYKFKILRDKSTEYDELYYNIIGTNWDTDIENASFTITMPKDFDKSKLNITSGYRDSELTGGVYYTVKGNVISGKITSALKPRQGVTVALPLNEGYFEIPKTADNLALVIKFAAYAISILLVLLAYFVWKKHGKDRELFAPVQFHPPNGLNSAELGYIIDGVVDNKDVTSLIILWASKGFIQIIDGDSEESESEEFTLVKLKDADDTMKRYEKVMFNQLFDSFGDGEKVTAEDLKNSFYATVNSTMSNVRKHFKGDNRLYTKKSKTYQGLFAFAGFIPLFIMILSIIYADIHYSYSKGFYFFMIAVTSLLTQLFLTGLIKLFCFRKKAEVGVVFSIKKVIGFLFAVVPVAAIATFASIVFETEYVSINFAIIAAALTTMFSFIIEKRTEFGSMCFEKILGFKDFLLHAEKPMLEELVDETPEYFYNTLAYAMVLGVSDKWAKKFESITLEPPNWYTTRSNRSFAPYLFYSRLNRSFRGMQNTMASMPAPKSGGGKSSFGGGSVGGGAGGGGGGSW